MRPSSDELMADAARTINSLVSRVEELESLLLSATKELGAFRSGFSPVEAAIAKALAQSRPRRNLPGRAEKGAHPHYRTPRE